VEKSEREKLILQKIKEQDRALEDDRLTIREHIVNYLKKEKLYKEQDIEVGKVFDIYVSEDCKGTATTDIVIKIDGRRLIAIKCAPDAIESRLRHIISLSRIADEFVIPISIITDAETTKIIDTFTGSVISEDIRALPSRAELNPKDYPQKKWPEDRTEKEKRILLAFESISCPMED